jgi:regulator of sigma E protease
VLLSLAAFVFVLGVLIFVHELGHFLAAKAVGIGVPRFSIGFGPATPLRFRRGETEYVVAWFPLGGYVKMASKEEQEAMAGIEGGELEQDYPPEKLFESKSLPARILVISAGVAMNMVFAWIAYTALAGALGRTEDPTTTIGWMEVERLPPAAAALADVPLGTQVVRVNGDTVTSWNQIQRRVFDPTSDRLRFDFAGDVDPVILPIPGTEALARAAVGVALEPGWGPKVGGVVMGFPAADAGIEAGDQILAVDGDTVEVFHDIRRNVEPRAGDTLQFTMLRGDSVFVVPLVPQEATERDPLSGDPVQVVRVGIAPFMVPLRTRYGLVGSVVEGWDRTWSNVELVLFTLKGILLRDISTREIGGPILIGQMSGQFARRGVASLIAFMALLSVNLAVLNLLPIPVLDGGHLVFLFIEGVRGRPLSLNARLRLTQLGMVVLIALMVYVFTNDIVRLVGG